jgi:hypothetical protein
MPSVLREAELYGTASRSRHCVTGSEALPRCACATFSTGAYFEFELSDIGIPSLSLSSC